MWQARFKEFPVAVAEDEAAVTEEYPRVRDRERERERERLSKLTRRRMRRRIW